MEHNGFYNFFNLGFFSEVKSEKVRLALGGKDRNKRNRRAWSLFAWFLVACGIFLRNGLSITAVSWNLNNLTIGSFLASCVISLAVFPSFMRWMNKQHPKPGLEHIATPFAFGFFLDLAAVSMFRILS
jgi:uncharacterized membrane protein (DUF4010 family)